MGGGGGIARAQCPSAVSLQGQDMVLRSPELPVLLFQGSGLGFTRMTRSDFESKLASLVRALWRRRRRVREHLEAFRHAEKLAFELQDSSTSSGCGAGRLYFEASTWNPEHQPELTAAKRQVRCAERELARRIKGCVRAVHAHRWVYRCQVCRQAKALEQTVKKES